MLKTKCALLVLGSIFINSLTFAGPVVSGGGIWSNHNTVVQTCSNSQYRFVIQAITKTKIKQGLLTLKKKPNNPVTLDCEEPNQPLFPNQPSAGTLNWKCREYPFHDGNYLVRIETAGFSGQRTAYISRMQMFPREPKARATMSCR